MDPKDLADRLKTEGGFSLNDAGNFAHSGTMISRAGSEVAHKGIASPEQIANYQQQHNHMLTQPGYYMGAWVEPKAGNPNLRPGSPVPRKETVLDVSQRFPEGHSEAANLQGVIHNQRAVFDVREGDVRPVNHMVLPMDYSHLDIETIHHPKLRHWSQLNGPKPQGQTWQQPSLGDL